jgi:hypothetical protein
VDDYHITPPENRKKRKIDVVALQSEFKRNVPTLPVEAARDLLDCGFRHVDELRGRSPESIFEQVKKLRPDTPKDRIACYRLMVYFAEIPESERDRNKRYPIDFA